MGLIYTNITLTNPLESDLQPIITKALVDIGSNFLCIPEYLAIQLNLKTLEEREVIIADGSKKKCNYVGPIKVNFENRQCFPDLSTLVQQIKFE